GVETRATSYQRDPVNRLFAIALQQRAPASLKLNRHLPPGDGKTRLARNAPVLVGLGQRIVN
ncbi:MAG: hypothetical protein JSU71_07785, partial [Betaproteobacteria bacterium]